MRNALFNFFVRSSWLFGLPRNLFQLTLWIISLSKHVHLSEWINGRVPEAGILHIECIWHIAHWVQHFSTASSFRIWKSSTGILSLLGASEELLPWQRSWGRRLGIRKGGIELQESPWEGLGAGGEGNDRGWDGWMASLTRWTWVCVNSRSWWWTGRPGVLWFMGSQSRTRLNDWSDLIWWVSILLLWQASYL